MKLDRTTTLAALAGSGGAALWTLFEFAMGWHTDRPDIGATTGFVGILFPLAALIWALRRTRRALGGRIALGQAMACGLAVSFLSAAIAIAFYYVYYTRINPGFLAASQSRGGESNLASQLMTVATGTMAFGVVVALIGGLAMRSRTTDPRADR